MKAKIILILYLFSALSITAYTQNKHCLLVGISDYGNPNRDPDPNKWSNISGANDVQLLAPKFKSQGYNVVTLVNASATHNNIISNLKKLVGRCKKNDVIYVHFSCHGQPVEDLNGDEKDGWDEAIVPFDAMKKYKKGVYEGQNHLLDDELNVYITQIRKKLGPSGLLYVVIDACHSGDSSKGITDHTRGVRDGFSKSNKPYEPIKDKLNNDYYSLAKDRLMSDVIYLEACRSYQNNKEIRDKETNTWYGSLSYYISIAMKDYMISSNTKWIGVVEQGMKNNIKLSNQDMVVESTVKINK